MKIHAFRLTKGMDLKKEIEKYVVNKKIKSGVILSAVRMFISGSIENSRWKNSKNN